MKKLAFGVLAGAFSVTGPTTPPPSVITTLPPGSPAGEHLDSNTNPRLAREDIKHGAVLCGWSIMIDVKAVSEKCHPREDAVFDATLDRVIIGMNRFITANSPPRATPIGVEVRRSIDKAKQDNICQGDGEKLYRAVHAGGSQALITRTKQMLAVPRPPVMNPCL